MIKKTKRFVLLTLIICFCFQSRAQANEIDSLIKVLKTLQQADSTKINVLNALSKAYVHDNPDTAIIIATESKKIAEQIKFESGLALSLKYIGIGYYLQTKYVDAIKSWQEALEVYKRIGDKRGIANILGNQGAIYFNRGDDAKALELHLQSLKISEEISDTLRILTCLNNIGIVYLNKEATYTKALDYFLKAFELSKKINDVYSIGQSTVNLGELYYKLYNDEKALYYLKITIKEHEGDEGLPYAMNYIGKVYTRQNKFKNAIESHQTAYNIAIRIDTKLDQVQSLTGLGYAYLAQKDVPSALATFTKALNIAKPINALAEMKEIYEGLTSIYEEKNDFTNAFKYHSLLAVVKDSIYNLETDKKLGTLQFDFDIKKKESQINLLNKDKKIQEQTIKRQKLIKSIFIGGFAIMLLFAAVFFAQRNKIGKEKRRSEALLLNILPEETAEELKATGKAKTKSFELVSVLFTDFKNFTQASEILTPEELVEEINYCYSAFDRIITKYGIEKIKTIGDSYMCAGGLPVPNKTNPFDIVVAGLEMVKFIEENKQDRIAKGQPYFELRLGVHSGPVVAGIVGIKKFAYDIWGDTVNTASRMESSGAVGRVNISGTTYEIVKDKFSCTHRGKIEAKNKGVIDMYFVEG